MDPSLVEEVAARRSDLLDRLRSLGRPDVTVVAVTKGFGAGLAAAARAAGFADLGENYAQEVVAKAPLVAGVRWHFLGQLQRNKVRLLAPHVHLWQSLDRLELLDEVARRSPGAPVCIQVNLSGATGRGGCGWADVSGLVEHADAIGLAPVGLMGVAPFGAPEEARPGFRRLVDTAERLGLPVRSIGMSEDFEVAVAEGATHIRVGRLLFGQRPPR